MAFAMQPLKKKKKHSSFLQEKNVPTNNISSFRGRICLECIIEQSGETVKFRIQKGDPSKKEKYKFMEEHMPSTSRSL